jgi:hypothetical protein
VCHQPRRDQVPMEPAYRTVVRVNPPA